jgi:hypothetical protein
MAVDETPDDNVWTGPPPVPLPPPTPGYGPATWALVPRGNVQLLRNLAEAARRTLGRFTHRAPPPEAEAALRDLERNIRELE